MELDLFPRSIPQKFGHSKPGFGAVSPNFRRKEHSQCTTMGHKSHEQGVISEEVYVSVEAFWSRYRQDSNKFQYTRRMKQRMKEYVSGMFLKISVFSNRIHGCPPPGIDRPFSC